MPTEAEVSWEGTEGSGEVRDSGLSVTQWGLNVEGDWIGGQVLLFKGQVIMNHHRLSRMSTEAWILQPSQVVPNKTSR
jgi:hypothetical protein